MRIALDIDNVVLDWQGHWMDLYTLHFDREVPYEVTGLWDACTLGTHFADHDDFFGWFAEAGGWDSIGYVPGAPGALAWLKRQPGWRFEFVTSRPRAGEESARALARKHGTTVRFLGNRDKHLAHASLWIDDSPEVLTNLAEHGKRAIRLERPWNEGAPATWSAPHWPAILEILEDL